MIDWADDSQISLFEDVNFSDTAQQGADTLQELVNVFEINKDGDEEYTKDGNDSLDENQQFRTLVTRHGWPI